jgi:ribonucleotide monophosphatase NagD (HAD superfamily)
MAITHTLVIITPITFACLKYFSVIGKPNKEIVDEITNTVASWYFNSLIIGAIIDTANMFF